MNARCQSDTLNQLFGPSPDIPLFDKTCKCRQQHILQNTALRQQLMILKDEPDVLIPECCQPTSSQSPRVFTQQLNQPGTGPVKSSRQIQQRAFSTAGRT